MSPPEVEPRPALPNFGDNGRRGCCTILKRGAVVSRSGAVCSKLIPPRQRLGENSAIVSRLDSVLPADESVPGGDLHLDGRLVDTQGFEP